jgi:hypothetical protein
VACRLDAGGMSDQWGDGLPPDLGYNEVKVTNVNEPARINR